MGSVLNLFWKQKVAAAEQTPLTGCCELQAQSVHAVSVPELDYLLLLLKFELWLSSGDECKTPNKEVEMKVIYL